MNIFQNYFLKYYYVSLEILIRKEKAGEEDVFEKRQRDREIERERDRARASLSVSAPASASASASASALLFHCVPFRGFHSARKAVSPSQAAGAEARAL